MSSSQHPIALSIEQQVRGSTGLLATVMLLPLVDGIFPALVLAGALSDPIGIVEVGLLIFGGSATVAVILAEMDGERSDQVRTVLGIGIVLVTMAVIEAALAPTIREVIDVAVFSRFAGIVIITVAAKTASSRLGDYLPRPVFVIGLGLVASLDPAGARLVVTLDPDLILRAGAAGAVGAGFALAVALAGPWLRNAVDIDRFRFGSAVALGVLPLSIYGLVPGNFPIALAVLGVTTLFAFDPQRVRQHETVYHPDEVDMTAAFQGNPDGGSPEEAPAESAAEEYDPSDERAPWM